VSYSSKYRGKLGDWVATSGPSAIHLLKNIGVITLFSRMLLGATAMNSSSNTPYDCPSIALCFTSHMNIGRINDNSSNIA
jgi:hypothetical protein